MGRDALPTPVAKPPIIGVAAGPPGCRPPSGPQGPTRQTQFGTPQPAPEAQCTTLGARQFIRPNRWRPIGDHVLAEGVRLCRSDEHTTNANARSRLRKSILRTPSVVTPAPQGRARAWYRWSTPEGRRCRSKSTTSCWRGIDAGLRGRGYPLWKVLKIMENRTLQASLDAS